MLAIDYDVVVRGLRAKYGDQKISAENERQYRSFFDKIIQLPFNMPQNNYNIENFLSVGLKNIGYFDKNQLQDKSKKRENDVLPILKDLVRYSTGNNPRSIIRIINSLSLINIMQNQIKNELTISDEEKILNFGLICMQIAYPKIYRLLQQYPDFAKDWKDKYEEIIRKFDLQNVDDEEGDSESGNSSNSSIAYDEDETSEAEGLEGRTWDRLIDAISLGDVYLKRHRADISDMLAIFETLFSEDIGSHVKSILNISAVTSVSNPKSGEDDHVSQTLSENNNADPIERFCKLIKDHFTDPDDQGKIDRKIDDSIKLYKMFFDGLKERYGNLIKFVCRKGIVVKVSNPSTHTRNIGWTYGFDYIRRGKFSFKILDSNFKSYSSLDEVDSSFYDEFTEVINKYSSDKVPENNKLRQH